MELVWLIPVAGVAAVLYAGWLVFNVLSRDPGTPAMQEIAGMIFEGAMAFLKRQYLTIALLALGTAVLLGVIVGAVSEGVKDITLGSDGQIEYGAVKVSQWTEGLMTGVAFLVGASASALAGLLGIFTLL